MEDKLNPIETLIQEATEYGKSSLEVAKLKALDKASDVVSTLIPHAIAAIFFISFLLFVNLGLALWIGKILENTYFGFFIVGGFYFVVALVVDFFIHKSLKKSISNYLITSMLN